MTKFFVKLVEHKATRVDIACHKTNCSVRRLNFHIAKKHSLAQPKFVHKCQICFQVFLVLNSLGLHRQKVHNAQGVLESKNEDSTELEGPIEVESLKEELRKCKQFPVDSEMECRR